MTQMAGIVIGRGQCGGVARRDRAQPGEKLRHILHLLREAVQLRGGGGIEPRFLGDVAVVLEHRTAAGDVDDDRIDIRGDGAGILPGEFERGISRSTVVVDRSAACL